MKLFPMFQKNPFLSQWMSAANASAGAWRGQWVAEVARQQSMMLNRLNKQAMQFWTGALTMTPSALAPAQTATTAPAPALAPNAVLAAQVLAPPTVAPQPRIAHTPAAPLRTSEQRRRAAKAGKKRAVVAPKKARKAR